MNYLVILGYVSVLVWPAMLVLVLLLFRGSVRALLSRIATQSEESRPPARQLDPGLD